MIGGEIAACPGGGLPGAAQLFGPQAMLRGGQDYEMSEASFVRAKHAAI